MKTQEEIEQLAVDIIKTRFNETDGYHKIVYVEAFKKGYSQCQEDMADKKYTEDMRAAMLCVIVSDSIKNSKDLTEYSKDITEYIASLNKQD